MIVLFGGQKGGTGKSTLVMNLAIERARDGRDVLVVDTDKQATASKFAAVRTAREVAPHIPCVQIFGKDLWKELQHHAERYDDLIVDTRGTDGVELRSAMVVADMFVSPVQPAQADLDTLERVQSIVNEVAAVNPELDSRIVFTRVPTNWVSTDFQDAKAFCADYSEFHICATGIRERVAFKRTHTYGTSVTEAETRDV
ncbi:MAG: chromosome partitioning protein, partial [Candidatus Zixiibacteriota bacterium]